MDNLLTAQEKIISIALQTQRILDDENIDKRNDVMDRIGKDNPNKDIIKQFAENSYVVMDYENDSFKKGPPNKLMPNLRGPYRVINSSSSRVTVQNLVNLKEETFHITQCKPFIVKDDVDPAEVAKRATNFWNVEKILNIKGKKDKKGKYL
jgi:hypothetical protein